MHRLIRQVALQIGGQGAGGFVAAGAVFFQALHHDPVELAAEHLTQAARVEAALDRERRKGLGIQRADALAGTRRLVFADDPPHLVVAGVAQGRAVEGRGAGQQLVEQNAQRIDVATGVDVQAAQLGLLGTHVQRRADHLVEVGEQRALGELLMRGLGDAKIDDLGHRRDVVQFHQDVAGLQIAVDHAFLVRVLHGPANGHE